MSDFPSFSWCEYSFWLVSLALLGIMEALWGVNLLVFLPA